MGVGVSKEGLFVVEKACEKLCVGGEEKSVGGERPRFKGRVFGCQALMMKLKTGTPELESVRTKLIG